MEIHKALQNYFAEQGLSQVTIAEKLGVNKTYVNALLSGRQRFGKKQAQIWEEQFGLSKSFLLTGEGEMLKNGNELLGAVTIKDRIKKFIRYKGIKMRTFEQSCNLSTGYVTSMRKGFGSDKLNNVLKTYPELNREWLLYGEGEMLKAGDEQLPEISFTKGAPYYDVDFLLGFDEIEGPSTEYPEYRIVMPGYEKATLWCNASGHSMEPEINNGDIIALQRVEDFSFLPFGDVYGFITTNGLRTIKRLGRSDQPGHYRLIPTNKDYDEQDIPINKIAIVYRVMGAMKPF